MNHTVLTDFKTFSVDRLVFPPVENCSIPGATQRDNINYKRVRINVRNPDGTIGELILRTPPNLMSFGVQENIDRKTQAVNGYTFPLCLYNRNEPTEDEKLFVQVLEQITERCKVYLVENRKKIEKFDLEMAELKKFSPLYWKKEKETGKIVEGRGPMLYSKVIMNKKTNQILTTFIEDKKSYILSLEDLLNKRCYAEGAIKIENIFVGSTIISLQVKLQEAVVTMIDTSLKTYLRPKEQVFRNPHLEGEGTEDEATTPVTPTPLADTYDDEEDDYYGGALPTKTPAPSPIQTPVRVEPPAVDREDEEEADSDTDLRPLEEDDDEEEELPPLPAKKEVAFKIPPAKEEPKKKASKTKKK